MATNFDARLASYSSPILSIFRIVFGLAFTLHGTMKMFGWPLGQAVPVGTWPYWWAGLIELVTGVLITIGLFTRIAAFIASGEMAVAYLWQHLPTTFWPYDQGMGGNGGEPALLYCFGFLAIAALGAGSLSVDARRRGRTLAGGVGANRVVTGTAAPAGYATGQPVRRGGLLSRFRRPRY
ncbi:DoxX family protein [Mycobacterium sp. 852013-51886_SCH5428379]|uniref:DoxX family protein n=1 Tax=Mycobacterium sp. 852013-51886_SCH5428379 TaxID=1834111 RepID=UPI00080176EC|nr:DoxX family protein [Mycobacterium sp. 852013-51886_SCH5428379]OBB59406.1 DoxX family protein [Mycobacterium sp. 852013-51886_SCH5428379]